MFKCLFLIVLSALLFGCTSTSDLDQSQSDPETSDNTVTVELEVMPFDLGRMGIDEYVELITDPETSETYLSAEAVPENYEIGTNANNEAFNYSLEGGVTIHKYSELTEKSDTVLPGLDSIFYLLQTNEEGEELWFGPFQGLAQ